jgi:regulator of ribonuclease activity A
MGLNLAVAARRLSRMSAREPGDGRVLVVDGGGSYRCALLGDNIANLALESGWAGIVIDGCVRDSQASRDGTAE